MSTTNIPGSVAHPISADQCCLFCVLSWLSSLIDYHLTLFTDGTLLLAASSLSGRSWQGSLWIYSDPEQAPNEGFCKAGVQTEAGITDIKWVAEKGVVVASDSGETQFHRSWLKLQVRSWNEARSVWLCRSVGALGIGRGWASFDESLHQTWPRPHCHHSQPRYRSKQRRYWQHGLQVRFFYTVHTNEKWNKHHSNHVLSVTFHILRS